MQGAGGVIIGVVPVFGFQVVLQSVLLLAAQAVPGMPELLLCGNFQPGFQFTVKPVCSPVRCLVGAVPPDGSNLHSAHGLPGSLAIKNALIRHQKVASGRNHLVRYGRCLSVDFSSKVTKQCEGDCQNGDQNPPEFSIVSHVARPPASHQPGGTTHCFPGGCVP